MSGLCLNSAEIVKKLPAMVLCLIVRLAEQHDAALGERHYRVVLFFIAAGTNPRTRRHPVCGLRCEELKDPIALAEARVDVNSNKSIDVGRIELAYIPRNSSGYDFVILTLQVFRSCRDCIVDPFPSLS